MQKKIFQMEVNLDFFYQIPPRNATALAQFQEGKKEERISFLSSRKADGVKKCDITNF